MNNKSYTHLSSGGTLFECERCDFSKPIKYSNKFSYNEEILLRDVAEMIAHHTLFIHPELSYFAGYDAIKFEKVLE